ncbi:MAG: flagellar basal body P-ring formation chaperone FlgA [bacterium]
MIINKLLKIFFFTGLFVFLFSSISPALTTIELKENVCLTGKEIFLKDIANLSNTSVDNIYIGQAPLPAGKRYITQEYVKLKILQAKIKEEDFNLIGATKIEITTSSQKLDVEEITKIAQEYILTNLNTTARIAIESFNIRKNVILPAGKVEYEIENTPMLKNQVYLPVTIKVNGTKYKTIRLGFKIHRFTNVVIAAKPLPRHHILTPVDIEIQEREITYINPAPIEDVIGKRLKSPLTQGGILTYNLIEIPPLIKRGDVVMIKKEIGALIVQAKGIAKEDGRLGDEIQVKNVDSDKIINSIVEDSRTVVAR